MTLSPIFCCLLAHLCTLCAWLHINKRWPKMFKGSIFNENCRYGKGWHAAGDMHAFFILFWLSELQINKNKSEPRFTRGYARLRPRRRASTLVFSMSLRGTGSGKAELRAGWLPAAPGGGPEGRRPMAGRSPEPGRTAGERPAPTAPHQVSA